MVEMTILMWVGLDREVEKKDNVNGEREKYCVVRQEQQCQKENLGLRPVLV